MAHVELSLSGAFVPQARTPSEAEFVPSLERWTATVASATEPCLIIDTTTAIAAVSASASELLGLGKPPEVLGQPLGSVLHLIDFTAVAAELEESDADKIPPLLALRSERLARGLLRVVPEPGETPLTIDAIATPLFDNERVAGSMTFFSAVRY
ncbi:PAS domain-containing protein [Actinoplanes sp. Pm04-4]|uniref:PAS domain-containing protein n=1 Tax=Paractinoplanes pyxinae TaxID=2997416 RepID=A0ABT4B488_9ACTN|nr:PAS domain-containing protein [Actinoplanes pyxinae]MCY1141290.1 PAS domain-containing protein [Actinoplanes pyxinae]